MSTVFTKIINREIPAHIIAENDEFIAFLDHKPIVIGHALVIPKREVDYIFEMEGDEYGRMFDFTKGVASALQLVTKTKRVGIAASGFEVPHVHIHLCPINVTSEMAATNPPIPLTDEAMTDIANQVREAYVRVIRDLALRSTSKHETLRAKLGPITLI